MNPKKNDTTRRTTDHVIETPKAAPQAPNTWRKSWLHYSGVLAAMPADKVKVCRADLKVVRSNVRFAIANLGVSREQITAALPKVPVDQLFELGELTNALVYSATRVVNPVSDGEIATRTERVSPTRARVLAVAEVLAQMGYFDVDVVARIRTGSGPYKLAEDCVALAGLFEERWDAIKGTHPFTSQSLEALRIDGEWLLDNITPSGARRPTPRRDNASRDARDRMWTALVERYDWLRRVAFYFHGEQFDRFVPKLQSFVKAAGDEGDEPIDAPIDGAPVEVPVKPEAQKPTVPASELTH